MGSARRSKTTVLRIPAMPYCRCGAFRVHNFCQLHGSLRVTPAMEAGITDHVWDVRELWHELRRKKSGVNGAKLIDRKTSRYGPGIGMLRDGSSWVQDSKSAPNDHERQYEQ